MGCYFIINAPKLECLHVELDDLPNILVENAKSLVKANVNFFHRNAREQEDCYNRATTLLAAISNVEYLSLSAHFLNASCIPAFDNLIHLKLGLYDCYHWELLAELLKRSPNLECLVLERKPHDNGGPYCIESSYDEENLEDQENSEDEANSEEEANSEGEANSEDKANSDNEETWEDEEYSKHPWWKDEEYSEHPWWNGEEFAPICLLSHLKTISINGFKGRQREREVAKYLLKNGKVLKKMTIYVGDFRYSKEKFYKEVSLFQRGSRACRVQFN